MNRPGCVIDNFTKNIKFNSVCAISWNNYKLCSRACSPELVLILCSEFILTFPIYSCTLSFLWVFMMIRGFEDVLFSGVHWLTLPEFPKSSCLFLMMIKWCLNEHSRMFCFQVFTRRLPTMRDQNRDSLAQIIFFSFKKIPDLKENYPIQNDDQDLQRNVSIICLSRELEATILEFMMKCHSVSQIWR